MISRINELSNQVVQYLDVCRAVWNHALYLRKLWYNSRCCKIDRCSLFQEYIVQPFKYPNYHRQSAQLTLAKKSNCFLNSGNAQAMQQTLRKLDRAFNNMKSKGIGFPRYKKKIKSFNLLGQIFKILEHICSKTDTYFAKVDKNYTSQICPNCGTHTGKKDLSIRVHNYPECGYTQNRDVAAAEVVINRGLTDLEFYSWYASKPEGLERVAVGTTVIKQPSDGGLAGAYA